MFKNVIFIIGAQKAGTTLLLSLLDNHPDIFNFPFELKYHKIFDKYFKENENSKDHLNDIFLKYSKFQYFNKNIHNDPYNTGKIDFEKINYEKLKEYLNNLPLNSYSRKDYFFELARSLFYSMNLKDIEYEYLLEKPGNHGLDYIDDYCREFPGCKIIHVVRNPYDTIAASKNAVENYKGIWGKFNLKETLEGIEKSFKLVSQYNSNNNYKIVKFEDLVLDSNKTMNDLSYWLNISFHENLIKPSILGNLWGGNSSSNMNFNGISKSPIGKYKKILKKNEIIYCEYVLSKYFDMYEYNIEKIKVSKIRFKYIVLKEKYITYSLNILSKYFNKIINFKKYPVYLKKIFNN